MINIDVRRAKHHWLSSKHLRLQRRMHIEIFNRLFRRAPANGLAATGCGHRKFRFLREHVELHARHIATGTLVCTAIIEADSGNEFHKFVAFRKRVTDERIGMRAEAKFHEVARNPQRLTIAILVDAHGAITRNGTLPFQRGQLCGFARFINEGGFHPISPVTTKSITAIGDHQMQLLRALDIRLQLCRSSFLGNQLRFRYRLGTSHLTGRLGARITLWLRLTTLVI